MDTCIGILGLGIILALGYILAGASRLGLIPDLASKILEGEAE